MDDIRAAAIERLTTHKERLVEEKIMKGKAVRALLNVVVGGPEEIATVMETEKARKRAEMQAAGETREIIFDEPLVIVTGVPRWERDEEYAAALERGDYKVPVWPVMKRRRQRKRNLKLRRPSFRRQSRWSHPSRVTCRRRFVHQIPSGTIQARSGKPATRSSQMARFALRAWTAG
jgi:hypothetical protein